MLQIISGKFFKSDERHVHEGRGILYSNYSWPDSIITCIAKLEPVDAWGTFSSYVISYHNQIEKDGLLVRTGDKEIREQFRILCIFGLRAYFDEDQDAVTIYCQPKPLYSTDSYVTRAFVPRFFTPELRGSIEDNEKFVSFVNTVIGLRREIYNSIIICLGNFNYALQALSYNVDLAYSLIIYSLESLSQRFHAFKPTWDDYDYNTRMHLDVLLNDVAPQTADKIRERLLKSSHLRLQKRFIDFICSHLSEEFFTDDEPQSTTRIRNSELPRALQNAYNMRSKFVHSLIPLQEQLRVPSHAYLSDVIYWENEPYLTVSGLIRVAHHVINHFIYQQETVDEEDINWRKELPGIIHMNLAPEYWIWKHENILPSHANTKLSGFLSQFEDALVLNKPITDIRDLLLKYEQLIPKASKDNLLSMLCLYILFNLYVNNNDRLPNYQTVIEANEDALTACSIYSMVIIILYNQPWEWTPEEYVECWRQYSKEKYSKNGLVLPRSFELAIMLAIGNQYRLAGNIDEFNNWYHLALLDAAGQNSIQQLISQQKELQQPTSYRQILGIDSRSDKEPEN